MTFGKAQNWASPHPGLAALEGTARAPTPDQETLTGTTAKIKTKIRYFFTAVRTQLSRGTVSRMYFFSGVLQAWHNRVSFHQLLFLFLAIGGRNGRLEEN